MVQDIYSKKRLNLQSPRTPGRPFRDVRPSSDHKHRYWAPARAAVSTRSLDWQALICCRSYIDTTPTHVARTRELFNEWDTVQHCGRRQGVSVRMRRCPPLRPETPSSVPLAICSIIPWSVRPDRVHSADPPSNGKTRRIVCRNQCLRSVSLKIAKGPERRIRCGKSSALIIPEVTIRVEDLIKTEE